MRKIFGCLVLVVMLLAVSCLSKTDKGRQDHTLPLNIYENELFSVEFPYGWVCDSKNWHGLYAQENNVEIYDPEGNVVWFYFVKSFLPIKWNDFYEAQEMALFAKSISGDDFELISIGDSAFVSGYLSSELCYANYVDGDTIIQRQWVTYVPDSQILMYFNANCMPKDMILSRKIADEVIASIQIKKVINPLLFSRSGNQ